MTTAATSVTAEDLLANASWARRLARNLLSDGDAADDLVQDTWMAALRAQPDRERPLRPWLARVLRNRAVNRDRDESRLRSRHDQAVTSTAITAVSADPEQLLVRLQLQRLLAELVTELPGPTRQVVLLRYYEDLNSEQIGQTLGLAAGTVRRRLKEGLDHLRRELDQRHQGHRETWHRALAPLLTAPAVSPTAGGTATPVVPAADSAPTVLSARASWKGGSPRPALDASRRVLGGLGAKLAVLTVVLVIGASAVLWWAAMRSPGGVVAAAGRAAAGASTPGPGFPGGGSHAALVSVTADACLQALVARRQELAVADLEYRRVARPELQFREGEPNPVAREAVLPDVERIMRGDAVAGPSFSLDCRTWVCRMVVLESDREEGSSDRWMKPLQRDPLVSERLARRWFRAGFPTKDLLSGTPLTESTVYLGLKDPSGRRMPRGPLQPVADPAPLPATPEACRSELARSEQRLTQIRDRVMQDLPPPERFEKGAPNPELDAEVLAMVDRVLATDGHRAGVKVECRGQVCRVWLPGAGDELPEDMRSRLQGTEEFRRRIDGLSTGLRTYFVMSEPGRPDGMDLLRRLTDEFKRSPGLAACTNRFPAQGRLEVRYTLPAPDSFDPDVEPGRIDARFGGTLAGTPLARCVEDEVSRTILSHKPPDRVKGAVLFRALDFPLRRTAQ